LPDKIDGVADVFVAPSASNHHLDQGQINHRVSGVARRASRSDAPSRLVCPKFRRIATKLRWFWRKGGPDPAAIRFAFRASFFTRWFVLRLFKEFLLFLRQEKKWWLAPLVVALLVLGALILFSGGSVLAPLMYPFL
jgi:hypothetical protein